MSKAAPAEFSIELVRDPDIFESAASGSINSPIWTSEDININQQNADGDTPLILALKNGHFKLANFLIEVYEADVNIKNYSGETPFKIAIEKKLFSSLRFIVEQASSLTREFRHYSDKISPLIEHIISGKEIPHGLLTKPGAVNEFGNDGFTALHIAVANNDMKNVSTLLEHGANMDIEESLTLHEVEENEARVFLHRVIVLSKELCELAKKGRKRSLDRVVSDPKNADIIEIAIKAKNIDGENVLTFANVNSELMDIISQRTTGFGRDRSGSITPGRGGSSARSTPTPPRSRSSISGTLAAAAAAVGSFRRRSSTLSDPTSPTSPLSPRRARVAEGEVDDSEEKVEGAVAIPGAKPKDPRSSGGSSRGGDMAHSV